MLLPTTSHNEEPDIFSQRRPELSLDRLRRTHLLVLQSQCSYTVRMCAVALREAQRTDLQEQGYPQKGITADRMRLLDECAHLVWDKMSARVRKRTTYTV